MRNFFPLIQALARLHTNLAGCKINLTGSVSQKDALNVLLSQKKYTFSKFRNARKYRKACCKRNYAFSYMSKLYLLKKKHSESFKIILTVALSATQQMVFLQPCAMGQKSHNQLLKSQTQSPANPSAAHCYAVSRACM